MTQTHSWWQTGVIYQIYPRSYLDSNGDGVGDLRGITSKLDYLRWLGVDAIWLSPIYPSPMADFGYDISNYTGVYSLFGTLQDLDTLLQQAHQRDLKFILDFVPNHTSDEHPWFQEARSSRTNEKRDWYIWRDPAPGGGPPNNWTSLFGGTAWQFDEQTGQYYLHLFDVKQPDLNWRNPHVRQAMYDVLRFWLDRGVDGFRVDVLWLLIKDDRFRDNPLNPEWKLGDDPSKYQEGRYTQDQPGIHEIVREMRMLLNSYGERVLIGEIYLPIERLVQYYGVTLDGAHLPFNFQFVIMPTWDARAIRQIVDAYEAALPQGAWPNWVLGNHDNQRIATKVGREQTRLAHMLLLTLRGTPTCYYGDEIGMQNIQIPREQLQDPKVKESPELSRDYERTPMQWNASANAGFAAPDVKPWWHCSVETPCLIDRPSAVFLPRLISQALRRCEPCFKRIWWRDLKQPLHQGADVPAWGTTGWWSMWMEPGRPRDNEHCLTRRNCPLRIVVMIRSVLPDTWGDSLEKWFAHIAPSCKLTPISGR